MHVVNYYILLAIFLPSFVEEACTLQDENIKKAQANTQQEQSKFLP
jgi:hypothetical protein